MSNQELLNKYAHLKDRKNIDIIRLKICPLNTKSKHDKPVMITEAVAKRMRDEVVGTPLMYSEDNVNLPQYHEDKNGNRRTLGTAIGAEVITDENGIQYLAGDYMVYTDANKDILEKVNYFKDEFGDDISASFEIFVNEFNKDTGEIVNGKFNGTSIMDIEHSAFQHHALMVATKNERTEENMEMTITYDDMMKKIVGDNYNSQISEKDALINDLKTQLESATEQYKQTYEQEIAGYKAKFDDLMEENTRLRDLNENII